MHDLKNFEVTVTSDTRLEGDQRTILVGSRQQALHKANSFGREHKYSAVIVAASQNDITLNLPSSADASIRQI